MKLECRYVPSKHSELREKKVWSAELDSWKVCQPDEDATGLLLSVTSSEDLSGFLEADVSVEFRPRPYLYLDTSEGDGDGWCYGAEEWMLVSVSSDGEGKREAVFRLGYMDVGW